MHYLFVGKVSTETQSIGIHNVNFFNNELAMHYRVIMAVFGCFESRERLGCYVLAHISRDKSKTVPE